MKSAKCLTAGKIILIKTPARIKIIHKLGGRNSEFRNNHTVAVLSIPDIAILEAVDVHVQPAIVVHVHVGNEKMCDKPSMPPSFEYSLY